MTPLEKAAVKAALACIEELRCHLHKANEPYQIKLEPVEGEAMRAIGWLRILLEEEPKPVTRSPEIP